MNGIGGIQLVFLVLLLFIVVLGLLARRLGIPYPIVMVVGGLLLGLVPGVPQVTLEPDLIFLVVLPPLLYAAAWTTPWRDFRYNFISIFLLAFGLVAFSVAAVALVAPRLFGGFDWRLGFVLGAIVAPTDAVAAIAIARQVGLPSRIVNTIEGESLINDATGLLALQFATAILVQKQAPALSTGILTLCWLTAGGVALGLLTGWLVDGIERHINDGPIEITLSILTPYAAYLAAQAAHASGVLAVVACGLFLSRRSATFFSPAVRILAYDFWESLIFVLNALVFVLIGLQLPGIRAAIHGYRLSTLLLDGAVFSTLLILLRLLWVFPGAIISWFVRTRILHHNEIRPGLRQIFITGWTGMRGVVSLAAALALPALVADGSPFPQRNLIVFLAFFAICVTLVLQGVTLPSLIRALGLAGDAGPLCEEREARRVVIEAAVSHLEAARVRDRKEAAPLYEDLTRHYRQRLASLQPGNERRGGVVDRERFLRLFLDALHVERKTAIRLRDESLINDEVLRHIERELDLTESRLMLAG
jgi:CPA1 family monovalent cation:H+ antiporter